MYRCIGVCVWVLRCLGAWIGAWIDRIHHLYLPRVQPSPFITITNISDSRDTRMFWCQIKFNTYISPAGMVMVEPRDYEIGILA